MQRTHYSNLQKTTYWIRNLSLVIAFTIATIFNTVIAQRISTSGGTYTIDNTGTNTGTNFTSFTEAINDLNNGASFTGNVIINVVSDQTFTENVPIITATGNIGATILFLKSGGGANPKITSIGTTSSQGDAAIVINGGDYFTFNGIDITASDSSLEFGYLIRKSSFDNAARYNTIINSTILMSRLKAHSYAILQSNDSIISVSATPFDVINNSLAQTNNNNTYTNITVGNAYNGIWLKGISTSYRDSNNVADYNFIGRTGFASDLGALDGTTNCYGIYASFQFSYHANNNTLKNMESTGPTYAIYTEGSANIKHNNNDFSLLNIITNGFNSIYGVYLSNTMTGEVLNNNVHDINATGINNITLYGLYSTTGNTVRFGNNNINNVTGGSVYGYYMASATNSRLTNNTVTNFSVANSGNGYLFYLTGGTTDTLDNNTANNCSSTGTLFAIYTATATSFRVYNNNIQNISAGTGGANGGINGLYALTPNNSNYYNNTISNAKTLAGANPCYGMYFSTITGTCEIYNNKITDFGSATNATSGAGSVYGAYFGNAFTGTVTCNFYNNVINGITKRFLGTATNLRYLHGLYFSSTGNATATYNIIHNSVSVDGSAALTSSSQVIYTAPTAATSPIMTLRNNIFVNYTGAQIGVAKHYLIGVSGAGRLGSASSSSNYNNWYLENTTNGYFGLNGSTGGADIINLAQWKLTSGFTAMEANSILENPLFNSTANMRLLFGSPAANTGLYLAAYPTDILGAIRNPSTPSRGAYEIPLDETKPTIVYNPILNVYSTGNYTLTDFATITDGTVGFINNTAGNTPRVYYKTTANANAFIGNSSSDNGWKYVEATDTVSPFSFTLDFSILLGGSVNIGDTVQYFVVATDTAAIANITSNPSAGFAGTGVGAITSAPTAPNTFVVLGMPAAYVGATVTQNRTGEVGRGTTDNIIIQVKVSTALTGTPAYVSQLNFTTMGGGNDSANITSAQVYYTGASSTFSTANLYGTTIFTPLITGTIGAFSVTGNALCGNGDSYFWLVYNLRSTALFGDSVDAELTSVVYAGDTNIYMGGGTAGVRIIRVSTCTAGVSLPNVGEDIGNVTFNTNGNVVLNNGVASPAVSNSSAINGYSNFTNSVDPVDVWVNQEVNTSISVITTDITANGCQAAIYIDYNHDGDFLDAGEMAWNSTTARIATVDGPFVGSFIPPCTATTGETIMRIVVGRTDNPLSSAHSCGTPYAYGEVEDYAIYIHANPTRYLSSSSIQYSGIIAPDAQNAVILRIPVIATGCGVGTLTGMDFSTTGSTNAGTDILFAKLYATGNANTFNTNKLLATVSSPNGAFSFTGLLDTLLTATNDTNNYWLAFDLRGTAGLGNVVDATVDSINVIGAYAIPTVTNPVGSRLVVAPMTYSSSNTVQASTSSIEKGSFNGKILRLEIVTSPTGSPIDLTSLDISTNGTDSLPDIVSIKVWYTGASNVFDNALQFGNTVSSPASINTVTGIAPLTNGANYFWVTYDIAPDAAVGHNIDGELTGITIGSGSFAPTITSPTGMRIVSAPYCASNTGDPITFEDIGNVTFITNEDTVLNNGVATPILSNTTSINGYTNFIPTVAAANFVVNQLVNAKVAIISHDAISNSSQAAIYIDYNQDGDFLDAEEMVWNSITSIGATDGPFLASFAPPCSALLGETRMRVVLEGGFTTTPLTQAKSCGIKDFGETEDYLVNIVENPVAYISSSAIQNTQIVAPNAINAQVLRIPIKAKGCGTGMVESMYFNTNGSTNAAVDISTAKLYSTGNVNTFNTDNLLGTVFSPNGSFSFTGLTDVLLTGITDTNNYWLVYDISAGAGLGNTVDAKVDSIHAIGTSIIPLNNNPSGSRMVVAPMTYTSSTTTQAYISKISRGDINNPIIGLEVVTSAFGSTVDFTSLDISTNGTDSLPDITNLKIWYTGTSNIFATTKQFGSTIAVPAATNTVNGLLQLTNGVNHFWVTYDVIGNASEGHAVDAEITSITLANVSYIPLITSPVGNRLIRIAPICTPSYSIGKVNGDLISNISIAGTTLSNNTGAAPVNPAYTLFTGAANLTATLVQAETYNITVTIGSAVNQSIAAWVDYDDDGIFSLSERVGYTSSPINTAFGSATFPITLTCASAAGQRRLRVRSIWGSQGDIIEPCNNGGWGEAEDYIITVVNNPVYYASSNVIQTTGIVAPGTTNAKLLHIPLKAKGCGINSISEMRFNTAGTSSPADITSAKLFATGRSAVFTTNNLLGTIFSPNGQFTFNSFFDTLLVSANDTNNYWLVYDVSGSATEHHFVDAKVDSIGIAGVYVVPANNNPAGNREVIIPMSYISSTVTAPTLSRVGVGETNVPIVRYEVTTSSTGAPVDLTSFEVVTTGTSLTDITNLKVYYTGTSPIFDTVTKFGATVIAPGLVETVVDTQTLVNGTNYFWITYDIADFGTIGNFVDAEVTNAIIDGFLRSTIVSAPADAREIRSAYCVSRPLNPSVREDIGNVTLFTAGTTALNNGNSTPALNNPTALKGYTYYSTLAKAQLYRNQIVNFLIGIISIDAFSFDAMAAIYIDYNQDGDFADADEMAWSAGSARNATTGAFEGLFTIPGSALLGETRMRVVLKEETTPIPLTSADVCGIYYIGETEDYLVDINALPEATVYKWNRVGTADFNTPSNWTPVRNIPFANDMLFIDGGGTITMTNVPPHVTKSFNVLNNTMLTLAGTGSITTIDSLNIEGGSHLNASGINIVVGSDILTIGNITGTGKISGTLKRWVHPSTLIYDFPITDGDDNRSINITYSTPPTKAGSITLTYISGAPGASGLPVTDASLGGASLENISDAGVWNLIKADSLTGGVFTVTFNADSIAGVNIVDQTAIVYRTDAFNPWVSIGTTTLTTGTSFALELNRAGLTGFGQFGIAGISSNPLPVSLTSFTALAKAKDANLTWTTAAEMNNKGFEVERSIDGKSFTKVAFVKGAGNSNVKVDYVLTDANAFVNSNILYYRLKQVDFNGKSTYSQIVKVGVNTESVNVVSAYPNPFTTDYNVSLTSAKSGEATIVMVDMQGRKVANISTSVNAGVNTIPVNNMATIDKGVYFISVTVAGETQTIKLVKN